MSDPQIINTIYQKFEQGIETPPTVKGKIFFKKGSSTKGTQYVRKQRVMLNVDDLLCQCASNHVDVIKVLNQVYLKIVHTLYRCHLMFCMVSSPF